MDNEILLLNKIGLTDTEAKVYLALLQSSSLTGYEASKAAGVSRSKIYVILECLINKGFILYTQYENNNKYAAVPISEIADKVKDDTKNTLSTLTERLSIFPQHSNLDDLWHIRTTGNVFAKCREIIRRTKNELLIQIWDDDLPQLMEQLHALEKKKVNSGIVIFNLPREKNVDLKQYYRHGMTEEKKEEMGGRWITLVSDMKEVIFGQITNDDIAEVIWTKSNPMIFLAAEYIRHDMYFYKIANDLPDILQTTYGKDLERIRDIYD